MYDIAIGAYRVVVGLLFASHGASTLFGVTGGYLGKGITLSPWSWPNGTAALIELVGGVLVLLGIGTRAAAILCSGTMAYAYFTVHQPQALWPIQNGGESAALFCWGFLMVALLGPGPWTVTEAVRRLGVLPSRMNSEEASA
jgi:putative oxidoreductase